MLGRIARQWRRLILGSLLFFLFMAMHLTFYGLPDDIDFSFGVSTVIAAALTALIVVGGVMLVLGIFWPGSLPFIEVLGLTFILGTPLGYAAQTVGLPSWVDFALFFLLLVSVERVLMGDWHPGILRRDTQVHDARFTVPIAPEDLWRRIVPLPAHAASYVRPATQFLALPAGQDGDFVVHSKRRWGLKDGVETVTVEANDAPRHFRYTARPSEGSAQPVERVDIRLTPTAGGTEVAFTITFLDVPVLMRLRLWIGQDAGDYAASVHNRLLGRRDATIHGRQIACA